MIKIPKKLVGLKLSKYKETSHGIKERIADPPVLFVKHKSEGGLGID